MIAYRLDPTQPQMRPVAEWLAAIAPSDPRVHTVLAEFLERNFDQQDLDRSLIEYQKAAGLAPNNYLMWLDLAEARDRHGDYDLADEAFARALELAPNYAGVQWAAGNALIRHKQLDRGFSLISRAADGDNTYAGPAVSLAFQLFDENTSAVEHALGNTASINSALSTVLAVHQRYDEAVEVWQRIPADIRRGQFKEQNTRFIAQLTAAKKITLAARASADVSDTEQSRPEPGKLINGGFEDAFRTKGATPFEWNISQGPQPQVGLSDSQRRSGDHSLIMNFESFESVGFRQLEQTVPVEQSRSYVFDIFYKADMKTKLEFHWEVVDIASGAIISRTPSLVNAADWTELSARFMPPASGDGVLVRFVSQGCDGPICPCSGKILFDDASIRPE
ncbi:MAG: hypothetical protein JO053_12080 [Acidobacteria bacterium]|nr:hypothetical protein [Acidobacteriota bacterium]